MDTAKLATLIASLASGIVLLLSIAGVIPSEKVESIGLAINQISGAVAGLVLMLLPSILSALRKDKTK